MKTNKTNSKTLAMPPRRGYDWATKLARTLTPDWDGFSNGFRPKNLKGMLARCKPIQWKRVTGSGL